MPYSITSQNGHARTKEREVTPKKKGEISERRLDKHKLQKPRDITSQIGSRKSKTKAIKGKGDQTLKVGSLHYFVFSTKALTARRLTLFPDGDMRTMAEKRMENRTDDLPKKKNDDTPLPDEWIII